MSANSKIEWTSASWNPVTGCTKVSPGCDHCYAETFAERWRGTPGHHFENGFDVTLRPERLDQPLRWRKGRKIFVNSMSDVFHEAVPDEYIARMFAVMTVAFWHSFQVLTKRHGRMCSLLNSSRFADLYVNEYEKLSSDLVRFGPQSWSDHFDTWERRWPLPNVWLGVSAENQKWADIRIPALLNTPAAIRFVSAEPLLEMVTLRRWLIAGRDFPPDDRIDWVICGGESGPGARPMEEDWARIIVRECNEAGVACFVKQLGAVLGREIDAGPKGGDWDTWPEDLRVRQFPRTPEAVPAA